MSARRLAGALTAALAVAACTSSGVTDGHRVSRPIPPSTAHPAAGACPAHYAAPDPDRPRMALSLTIAADHRTITGVERVRFVPDRPITELVFRLVNNSPTPAAQRGDTSTTVTSATAGPGGGRFTVTPSGASDRTQGGLLHIPLAHRGAAGVPVTASIGFRIALGEVADNDFPRLGRAGGFVYVGSPEPLLSWERGYGWHTEDLVGFPGETATSEAMDVDESITAPAADTVIASGDPVDPPGTGAPTRTWHAHLDTARDVSVAAGPFRVVDARVGTVRLRVGSFAAAETRRLVPQFRRAITALVARYGPFPFPSLSIARLPVEGGGIEYPSSILMIDGSREVAVHETAHQWFYAMVGDSQAQHPWLDEAFAQYSEELVDGAAEHSSDLRSARPVDASIESYGTDADAYYFTTYNKGSAALEAARSAAGGERFDSALRCYVAANAWRIVHPSDLAQALVQMPSAVAILRRAGAVP